MSQEHDTETAFMEATYRALCEHGYADLTMQDIADETDKSKAALHYHFEGKDDLFRNFLAYLHEDFAEKVADHPEGTPVERLVALVRRVVRPVVDGDGQHFNTAFMEIKAQAPYREGYREALRRFDDDFRAEIASLVAEARDEGQYPEDVDPHEVAEHVLTYVHGTWTRAAAIGADVTAMREHLVDDLLDLLVEDAEVPVSAETRSDATLGTPDADSDAETIVDVDSTSDSDAHSDSDVHSDENADSSDGGERR